jgi:hypothetical protein
MAIRIINNNYGGRFSISSRGLGGKFNYTADPTLFLDSYPGATLAYSFRKLKSSYTGNAIRVRRSSDNTQQDIGFVNNQLDTASLLTFCGAGNGFVTIWYDQSGTGNNSNTSVSTLRQPQIVFSGALLIKNSRIYITAVGDQQFNLTTSIITTPAQNYSWWFIYEKDATQNQAIFTIGAGSYLWLDYQNTAQYINNTQTINISPFNYVINTQYLVNHINAATNVTIYANNVPRGSVITTFNTGFIQFPLEGFHSKITMTELIYYPSNQSANRTAITNNINSYYSIY